MNINNNINNFRQNLPPGCKLIAVSKTQPVTRVQEAYDAGQRIFGENKVQELVAKYEVLPKDIQWHMIGHLQTNKVKYIAPFIHLIHSIDSVKLLEEINKQGAKAGRIIHGLLQIHIAREETKFGFSGDELLQLIDSTRWLEWAHVQITGLMAMATFTENQQQIREEFQTVKKLFDTLKQRPLPENVCMRELSIGMSGDYQIAIEEGSTMIRIGTAIFGERQYIQKS
jgi:PLP dependent protein